MELSFNSALTAGYNSSSQKIRILTEDWVSRSIFCPNCGEQDIEKYGNNKPVADFYCDKCREDYELKSKRGSIGLKIVDGAYRTMIERLEESHNPNFFLLNYNMSDLTVNDFFVIPKHFFVPKIIEERKPLSSTARRAGWIGCNILLNHIPQTGKIFFVKDRIVETKEKVIAEWKKTLFLREEREVSAKGWLLDVMRCVEKLGKGEFVLDDIYKYEAELGKLHPDNNHIRDKIRQQLQILRDKGYLNFSGRGEYKLS